jgi:glycolate oxidase FAD binding subunit
LVASAGSGPLRLSEGTVRDLLIGVGFVGHGGRAVRGGGRVVKNVAGYDLMKVMTGSFGTLGIITEVIFRMRPLVENYQLAVASNDDAAAAFETACAAAEAAPLIHLEVTSPAVSTTLRDDWAQSPRYALVAGFGGIRAEIDYQAPRIADALGPGAIILAGADAIALYERLRDYDVRADASSSARRKFAPTPDAVLLSCSSRATSISPRRKRPLRAGARSHVWHAVTFACSPHGPRSAIRSISSTLRRRPRSR